MSKFSPFDLKIWEIGRLNPEDTIKNLLTRSHKFLVTGANISVFAEFGDQLITSKLLRLPFDEVLFEFATDGSSERIAVFGTNCEGFMDHNAALIPYARDRLGNWAGGIDYIIYLNFESCSWECSKKYETDPIFAERQWVVADIFAGIIAMINSDKIPAENVQVPRKLSRARDKANRPPIFDYTVLDLSNTSTTRNDRGGTHAPPTLHWRRGHLRRLPGKLVPVSPCLVGDIENGITVKDYNARNLA